MNTKKTTKSKKVTESIKAEESVNFESNNTDNVVVNQTNINNEQRALNDVQNVLNAKINTSPKNRLYNSVLSFLLAGIFIMLGVSLICLVIILK